MSGYYQVDINELHKKDKNVRQPFKHQEEAFKNMSKLYTLPIKGYKGSLLVLPTGGGKTFTAVNWICRNIISKGIKVLWMAQSLYLLEQAEKTFREELHSTINRDIVNLRIVSSSSSHCNSGSIKVTDDILICTTQSAIKAYNTELLNVQGEKVETPFRKFINSVSNEELFIVIDEAHHAPAYGCRTLINDIKTNVKNLYVLGLTATPTHNDERISGWLWKIFDSGVDRKGKCYKVKEKDNEKKGICYQADETLLQSQNILSPPKFIQKDTNMEFEIDDKVYERLTVKHKDLPDYIIDELAKNSSRNDMIVSDYLNHKNEYGKTLIFADRWYQCEHIVSSLKKNGIKANAVYSKISKGKSEDDNLGRRDNKENEKILKDFRNNKYDVIVNVKMLTEGVDVPDVKTVMITRQTTSPILFTQMVGRALRGKMAGGGDKDYANIVLFTDKWSRQIPLADGGTHPIIPVNEPRSPLDYISIKMVQLACNDIEFNNYENMKCIEFIPIGWFALEYSVISEEIGFEQTITFEQAVVYNFNKEKYDKLIEDLLHQDLEKYSGEEIKDEEIEVFAKDLESKYFDKQKDDFDECLEDNIIKIVRHISQTGYKPEFFDFLERGYYDLDKVADEVKDFPVISMIKHLKTIFFDESKMWNKVFGDFEYFVKMVMNIITRREIKNINDHDDCEEDKPSILTDELRKQVLQRDKYTCLCCGKKAKQGRTLTVDHIIPISMGGKSKLSNLQTLCNECNIAKERDEINYNIHVSPLNKSKELKLFKSSKTEEPKNTLKRIINDMYHCGAVCEVKYHKRKTGQYYNKWLIRLYEGNDTSWLDSNKKKLIKYINEEFDMNQVEDIIIK